MEQRMDLLSRLQATADKLLCIAEESDSTARIGSAMRALAQTMDIIERVEAVYTGGENEKLFRELLLALARERIARADMWRMWLAQGGTGYTKGEFFRRLEHHGVRFRVLNGVPTAYPPEKVLRTGQWKEIEQGRK